MPPRKFPEFDFVFIGPNYDQSMDGQPVFDLDNVHWLGPKDYDELPRYLQEFSVATIPFVLNDVTHAVSPVKLHEYLAAGKPVVATRHARDPHLRRRHDCEWRRGLGGKA